MKFDAKSEYAVSLLRDKSLELERLPQKSDFPSDEVCLIKQKLGPWPRALEAAGLKPPPEITSAEKSRLKRERSRKLRKQRNQAEKKCFSEKESEE